MTVLPSRIFPRRLIIISRRATSCSQESSLAAQSRPSAETDPKEHP
jgi:hypothetical protein